MNFKGIIEKLLCFTAVVLVSDISFAVIRPSRETIPQYANPNIQLAHTFDGEGIDGRKPVDSSEGSPYISIGVLTEEKPVKVLGHMVTPFETAWKIDHCYIATTAHGVSEDSTSGSKIERAFWVHDPTNKKSKQFNNLKVKADLVGIDRSDEIDSAVFRITPCLDDTTYPNVVMKPTKVNHSIRLGDTLKCPGYPAQSDFTIPPTMVSSPKCSVIGNSRLPGRWQSDCGFSPGQSGCPLVQEEKDSNGKIVLNAIGMMQGHDWLKSEFNNPNRPMFLKLGKIDEDHPSFLLPMVAVGPIIEAMVNADKSKHDIRMASKQ